MTPGTSGQNGYALEELLRAYFLRTGFFVVRGVPLTYLGEDLTDVDLLLYESTKSGTRRVQIVDIKYKQKPKAVERMFWTRGLLETLGVDGAYVATTDSRTALRRIAARLELMIIDGKDLQRIREKPDIPYPNRLSDEELVEELRAVDRLQKGKGLQEARRDVLSSLSEGFGVTSLVRSLDNFTLASTLAITAHPDSARAIAAGRLCYLSAAIAAASLDYVSAGASFRSVEERKELLLNAIRHGAADTDEGTRTVKIAIGLAAKYTSLGSSAATQIQAGIDKELKAIPAEIVADQAARLLREDSLFTAATDLDAACYNRACPPFDILNLPSKMLMGALLDYAGINRQSFAAAWSSQRPSQNAPLPSGQIALPGTDVASVRGAPGSEDQTLELSAENKT